MPGKSTTNAAVCLFHDIHAADNYNPYKGVITFDITGYFDNVNHNIILLAVLLDKGISLPICKQV